MAPVVLLACTFGLLGLCRLLAEPQLSSIIESLMQIRHCRWSLASIEVVRI
jgi:hypothetical protein